ncbi:MAG: hypothetical protein CMJ90_04755 [Planctomycetes bacterium]|nr:hypothetical protein [Planctomycetota bacterium]
MTRFFLFFLVWLFVSLVVKAHKRNSAVADTFDAVARRRGLRSKRRMKGLGSPTLSGVYKGYEYTAEATSRVFNRSMRAHTSVKLTFPQSLDLGLHLEWQGMAGEFLSMLGKQDVRIGDDAFDQQVVIHGDDPETLRAFLTPTRRFHCQRFLMRRGRRVIHDGGIHVELRGRLQTEEALDGVLESMAALADQLVDSIPPPLSQAIEEQSSGALDEALQSIRAMPTDTPEALPDRKVLEGEILYTGARYEEAADAFAIARDADPTDAEAAAWHDRAAARASGQSPPPLPEDLVASAPEPGPAAEPHLDTDSISFDVVCATLFAPDIRSLQVSQLFEQRFEDAPVTWTGELQRANRASFDLVFGNDPCTKAVLGLGEYGEGLASRMIHAVAQFPEDMAERLGDLQGTPVRFSGRLVRCDPFMRNLFVADAKLIS